MQGSSPRTLGGDAARLMALARCVTAPLVAAARLARRGLRAKRVEIALADWRAWSARVGRRGATVRCTEGLLWVTREGDAEDHLLRPGEELRVPTGGLLALVALGPARGVVAGDLQSAP